MSDEEYPSELIETQVRSLSHRPDDPEPRVNINTQADLPEHLTRKIEILPTQADSVVETPNDSSEAELPPRLFTPEMQPENMSPIEQALWRKQVGFRVGIDNDGHKIGLCSEPGAAAGVVSFAML